MELYELAAKRLKYFRDGSLRWRNPNGRSDLNDRRAGSVSKTDGYRYVKVNQKRLPAHRIVFYIHNGFLPQEIDHKNKNRDDNRIENLRECKHIENSRNQTTQTRPKSSRFKGVCFDKSRSKWVANAKIMGKSVFLGRFSSEFDAALAYNHFAKRNYGEYASLNEVN